jgi:UDP-2-acetamido-2,6-beta-L-arabino-hexul-4-ose reductase
MMHFYYIDDVIDHFVAQLIGDVKANEDGIYRLPESQVSSITLGQLADKLYYFRDCQRNDTQPYLETVLDERLWSTYVSYGEEY